MWQYSIWLVIAIVFTNVVESISANSDGKLMLNKMDSLRTLRLPERRNNTDKMSYAAQQKSQRGSFNEIERISERKCREYQYELSQQKPLDTTDEDLAEEFQNSMLIAPRISGGQETEEREFPHVVALGWFEKHLNFFHRCGGSLISEKWILTAAHCADNFLNKHGVARLGITSLSAITSGVIIGVVEIIRHPQYKHPELYGDIALMKLARAVVVSDAIRPACLHSKLDDVPKMAWATGWGSSEFGDVQMHDTLRKTKLEIVDTLLCALGYKRTIAIPHGIAPSMICAGDPHGGWTRDTCNGDSGGPLQIFNVESGMHVIVGITSFGKLCGTPHFPGIYTRVAYYLQWIESIVWPATSSLDDNYKRSH
ncbi:serine protease snake-like [Diachasmimorpha longicaudata]|uniref:serine protease snake-like n=1 Tax=Diachasmimorpha longicaudata TaxID=58733 RepID=UPI0030B8C488